MRIEELTDTVTSNFAAPSPKMAPSVDYKPVAPFFVVAGPFHAFGVQTEREALDMFVDYGYEVLRGMNAFMCDRHGVVCIAYDAEPETTAWFGIRSTLTLFKKHRLVNPLVADTAMDAIPGMT